MDRKSEPLRAEIEWDIVGRREGNIDYRVLAKVGDQVLVETGEGGAAAAPEAGASGQTSGKLGDKCSGAQQPRSPKKAGRPKGVTKDAGVKKYDKLRRDQLLMTK